MFKKLALLAEEAGDGDDGGGGGASTGGSPEGGQDGKPNDGGEKQIPESRLKAALKDQERRLTQAFEDRLAEATKAKPASQSHYTKAQLDAAVAAGQITQEQADAQLQAQADERASRVALETVSAAERSRLVSSEVARYKAIAPEILDDSHETRKSIQAAFDGLVELGDNPKDVATQLKAIRSVLGPIDRLERSRSGRSQHDTHVEIGGSGGSGGDRKQKTGKLVDQLNADSRRYYERKIESGVYPNWDVVESELKYAKPAVRQRLGIAA